MNGIYNGFTPVVNVIEHLTEDERKGAEILIKTWTAYSKIRARLAYVVDYYNKEIAFVSDRLRLLCGIRPRNVPMTVQDFYQQILAPEEIPIFEEIKESSYTAFDGGTTQRKLMYSFQCDVNIITQGGMRLYNLCAIPFYVTGDNRLMLMSCDLSPSSQKAAGNAVIRSVESGRFYKYDYAHHLWMDDDTPQLTSREKEIMAYSAQGYTEEQISEKLFKSVHSVKASKRILFEKLGVNNMLGALMFCINHDLL